MLFNGKRQNDITADTKCRTNVGVTLVYHRRRWTNVKPTLAHTVSAGIGSIILTFLIFNMFKIISMQESIKNKHICFKIN